MKQKIINIKQDSNYRIIAISDIHGHYSLMEKMLNRLNLTDHDYLIIIGDFINRGGDSIKSYKLIKELSRRKNTFILKGNHEYMIHRYLQDKDNFHRLYDFLKFQHYETIIDTMLKENSRDIFSFNNCDELFDYMNEHHSEMIDFLSDLPVILNFNNFTFVHGGYDKDFCLPQDEAKFLKFDKYNEISKKNEKKIIVGHWPTCNLRINKLSNDPYFNDDKNIIFIDGGLGVKGTGELNALIIDKHNDKINYSYLQENNFKKKVIKTEYKFSQEDCIYIDYPHYGVEILQQGVIMSVCKHLHSGKHVSVFNSLIDQDSEQCKLKINYVNNFLNLKVGEEVNICHQFDDCVLVKYNNEFGWIMRYQID